MFSIRLFTATFLAAALGFGIHVLYGQGWAIEYVQGAAEQGRLDDFIRQPYPAWFVVTAGLTTLLPTFGKVVLYLFIRDKLPSTTKMASGLCFGFILLAIDGDFLRMPIMSLVGNNPVDVMLVQSIEGWMIPLLMGLVIAYVVPESETAREA